MKNRFVLLLLGALVLLATVGAFSAQAGDEYNPPSPPDKVFVCKYVGTPGVDETLQSGQNPISVSTSALEGTGFSGSFPYEFSDAQGRSVAIAYDTGGGAPECPPGQGCTENCEPPTDVCPNLEGDQGSLPPGYHFAEDENGRTICVQDEVPPGELATGVTFTEATCTTPPAFQLVKTFIPGLGLRPFYNVDGPDFVDGHPVAGGTYTFTPIPVEGYVFVGGTEFTHTFAATPTDCGGVHVVVGDAQVICLLPAGVYQLSGHVDGQVADKVEPATLPGNTKGVSNVVVTRGDTSVRTTVSTNGDCGTTTTVTTVPVTPASVATPATPATPAKPAAAKPKPKPVVKPKPKPKKNAAKPKPPKKAKKHATPKKPPHTLGLG